MMCDLFTCEDVRRVLFNKFVVVMGGSVQRMIYKDMVTLLQSNNYLSIKNMRQKGEYTHESDQLLAGGRYGEMKNDVSFREVRQYRTDFHMLRFYFMTRVYSEYMENVLTELTEDPRPDVIIMNCCLWDIADSSQKSVDKYKQNLQTLMKRLTALHRDCLVIWITIPPAKGGVQMGLTAQNKVKTTRQKKVTQVYPEVEFLGNRRRLEIMAANMYARQVIVAHGFDVLDMHYFFRREIHRRIYDDLHWDMTGHRRFSNLLLTHIAEAWGMPLPNRVKCESLDIMNPLSSEVSSMDSVNAVCSQTSKKKSRKIRRAKRRIPIGPQDGVNKPAREPQQFDRENDCFTETFSGESANMHGYFRFDDEYNGQPVVVDNHNAEGCSSFRHQQTHTLGGYVTQVRSPRVRGRGQHRHCGRQQINPRPILQRLRNMFQAVVPGAIGEFVRGRGSTRRPRRFRRNAGRQ